MSWLSSWWRGRLDKGIFFSWRLPWFKEKDEPDNLHIYDNDKQVEQHNREQIMKGDKK